MQNIHDLSREISRDLAEQFEDRLRAELRQRPKSWLIDQIVRLSMPAYFQATEQEAAKAEQKRQRAERIERLYEMRLCHDVLSDFLAKYDGYERAHLIEQGYLHEKAPEQGTALITHEFRSPAGTELLIHAKDLLFGLLFGSEHTNTDFQRIQREVLSLTLPRHKADALNYMQATTQHSVLGTWQDPESVSNDVQAENIIFEVEYGEVGGELIGKGIVRCLHFINLLEVNEQILYARMTNVEDSTLISEK